MIDTSREGVLAYIDVPKEHRPGITSTNPLERLNKKVKRRTDVVGVFPNDEGGGGGRRYMSLEALARVTSSKALSMVMPKRHECPLLGRGGGSIRAP